MESLYTSDHATDAPVAIDNLEAQENNEHTNGHTANVEDRLRKEQLLAQLEARRAIRFIK